MCQCRMKTRKSAIRGVHFDHYFSLAFSDYFILKPSTKFIKSAEPHSVLIILSSEIIPKPVWGKKKKKMQVMERKAIGLTDCNKKKKGGNTTHCNDI